MSWDFWPQYFPSVHKALSHWPLQSPLLEWLLCRTTVCRTNALTGAAEQLALMWGEEIDWKIGNVGLTWLPPHKSHLRQAYQNFLLFMTRPNGCPTYWEVDTAGTAGSLGECRGVQAYHFFLPKGLIIKQHLSPLHLVLLICGGRNNLCTVVCRRVEANVQSTTCISYSFCLWFP